MTLWGWFLLLAYLGLGLGNLTSRSAARLVVGLTVVVVAGVVLELGGV